jgi:hypothetical protein
MWILPVVIAALTVGHVGTNLSLVGERSPFPQDYSVVAQGQVQSEENADQSAKMGEDDATKSGDESATPEIDTKKVDQPERQNPTTSN